MIGIRFVFVDGFHGVEGVIGVRDKVYGAIFAMANFFED